MPEVKIITATYLRSKYIVRDNDDRDWYSSGVRVGELEIVCENCRNGGVKSQCWHLSDLIKELQRK